MKRSHVIAAVALLLVGVVWVRGFWFTEVFRTHKGNENNRAALLRVYDSVDIGAGHSDVLAAFWQQRGAGELRLDAGSPDVWYIRMPLEFGANDWMLRIEFRVGKVVAVKVRTSDGPPPKNGPKDKQISDHGE